MVSRTVNNAATLLITWTRILSQTEHNQRLILNPTWQGASQDISDMEKENAAKSEEKERRDIEDVQRREATARRVEEDERRREEAAAVRGIRGPKLRTRGGRKGSSSSHAGVGEQRGTFGAGGGGTGGSAMGRAGSGIGRGLSGRGRVGGRGTS